MSAPTAIPEIHAPAKATNARKRAHSPDDDAAPLENVKPAKRARAAAKPKGGIQIDLTGPFNLIYMHQTFRKAYTPNETEATHPESLYKMLLARQDANEGNPKAWTANITIPADYKTNSIRKDVQFRSESIIDPMMEGPFELVATNFKHVAKPGFKSKFGRPTLENGECNAAGLKAALKIEGGGSCGINTASGSITLRPLWRKVGEDGKVMELFEGNFTFKARFGTLYSKKGLGTGVSESVDFWAIRGKN